MDVGRTDNHGIITKLNQSQEMLNLNAYSSILMEIKPGELIADPQTAFTAYLRQKT